MGNFGGLDLDIDFKEMRFVYGPDVYGPEMEQRRLDDIRKTLKDPFCDGPEVVYTIAMDIGEKQHQMDLMRRNLLYGACIYGKGKMGLEPIRSQGHIHAVSASCGSSTPELYEIWYGEAYIVMQASAKSDAKEAYAVHCKAGDKVIVPPGYAHYTLNADPADYMAFGAWCIRDYGFDYKDVRAQGGLMYFPVFDQDGEIKFEHNPRYLNDRLIVKEPECYEAFGLRKGMPIYEAYRLDRELFGFVTRPLDYPDLWEEFLP